MFFSASKDSMIRSCQWLSHRYTTTGTRMGKVCALKCLKIFKKNSFSKKHIVLSATYRWGLAMHLTILFMISLINGSRLCMSLATSIISNSSDRNRVCLVKLAKGQNLRMPSIRLYDRLGSLEINNMEHLWSSAWNLWHVWTLCSNMIVFLKNIICSSLSGVAKPEMIEANMSYSSDVPLNL